MDLEELFRKIEGKAALGRYLASSATINPEMPDRAVLAGLADASGEIEELVRTAKQALSVTALGTEVTRSTRRSK